MQVSDKALIDSSEIDLSSFEIKQTEHLSGTKESAAWMFANLMHERHCKRTHRAMLINCDVTLSLMLHNLHSAAYVTLASFVKIATNSRNWVSFLVHLQLIIIFLIRSLGYDRQVVNQF